MTLIRYEPWQLVNRLHRELDHVFGDTFGTPSAASERAATWLPSVDVEEVGDKYVLRADLPGVESKDIEITAENGVLTLRGERRFEKRENSQPGFERLERTEGTFVRRFTLPENAQTDKIRAKQLNGVLEIVIPKPPQVEPKRINVEAA
jgi:HSP20 family protein